jgi:hypothetical protein
MTIKKFIAMWLGVIYDSPPPAALLLVVLESYMTTSQPEYIKTPPQTGRSSSFLIEKSPKTAYF